MNDFANKVALITGGANGFGKAFAMEAARRGMKLAVVDNDRSDLCGVTEVLKAMGAEVLPINADVTVYEDVKMSVAKTMEQYGEIDLLFCNAGVVTPGDIFHLPPQDWQWVAYSNTVSHGYYFREVLPIMIKQGSPAHILSTASIAGILHGIGNNPAYSATKHAAVAIAEDAKAYCKAHGIENIGFSVFCPGYIQTDLHHAARHRPPQFKVDDPYYQTEYFKQMEGRINVNIVTGTPLDPVGPYLFKCIERNQLYIIYHSKFQKYIEGRHRKIEADGANPTGGENVEPGDYRGQVALITGGASGFGLEFAKAAAKRGMKLALVDIDKEALEKVKEYFHKEGAECLAMAYDVSLFEDVDRSVKETMDRYGRIDLLFCNAGIAPAGDIVHLPAKDWEWAVATNMLSHAYYYYLVLPIMEKQGTPAKVLATASIAGVIPGFGKNPGYSATKHGAVALFEATSMKLKEMGLDNIQASLYCPGFVQTNLHHSYEHKPERFRDAEDPYYQSEDYAERVKGTEHSIVTGIPLEGVGDRLFKGLDAGQKYILTHEQYLPVIKARHAAIEKDSAENAYE